jgi:hypothetical protein
MKIEERGEYWAETALLDTIDIAMCVHVRHSLG